MPSLVNLAHKTPKDKELGLKNIPDSVWQLSDHDTGFGEVGRTIRLIITHLKDLDHELTATNVLIDILYSALPC